MCVCVYVCVFVCVCVCVCVCARARARACVLVKAFLKDTDCSLFVDDFALCMSGKTLKSGESYAAVC